MADAGFAGPWGAVVDAPSAGVAVAVFFFGPKYCKPRKMRTKTMEKMRSVRESCPPPPGELGLRISAKESSCRSNELAAPGAKCAIGHDLMVNGGGHLCGSDGGWSPATGYVPGTGSKPP